MGRIVVTEFISLDGVVQAPGGEDFEYQNWSFEFDRGDEGEQFKTDEALAGEALLLGRVTYEGFADAWPKEEGVLADKLNGMRKYVVSSTLTDPMWNNTQVISGDVATEVARLKDEVDGELQVAGSIRLAQELLERDLVDGLHLMTYPVLLGHGRKLFGETPDRTRWRLTESRPVGEGVLITLFERDRA
ncbi:dihydrofolate reductase [Jiangella ureilytica]|uniref:Dihydrofolate reductase n=1 Tax=Jiangella ureilytica TaxID=2530374 RepID=A0A4R4RHV8_9ACTN|nr:dihydrofolate reductase family protein [Jiangella ureilytica]TDC48866.1 dihydrofolate reductase [Jiangella ureilytica]